MKDILDACCGGRMMWFDKANPRALFVDNRRMKRQVIWEKEGDKRYFEVSPDQVMDFRKLDLPGNSFSLVVFDPPHLSKRNGKSGWMEKRYCSLNKETWREDLRLGFAECFRVLKPTGVLIFKWSESDIPLRDVLALTTEQPLFGHKSGKAIKSYADMAARRNSYEMIWKLTKYEY